MDYFFIFFFLIFTFGGKKKRTLVTVAMDHKNFYFYTALQTDYYSLKKLRTVLPKKDNVVTVCQYICKSLSA